MPSLRSLTFPTVLALVLAWIAAGAALAAPARAQNDAAQSAQARALFRQGVEAADRQAWSDAADLFRRAMALRPSPVIEFNLAQALIHLGGLVEATEHLRHVVRAGDADRRVRANAQSLLRTVEPRLGTLTIRIAGDPAGASVRIDGRPLSDQVIGVAAPADPGARRITAHRGDAEVASAEVQIAEGGTSEVTLDVPPAPIAPTPVETARQGAPREERRLTPGPRSPRVRADDDGGSVLGEWWFWAVVGVVVAGGAVAAFTVMRPEDPEPVQGSLEPGVVEVP